MTDLSAIYPLIILGPVITLLLALLPPLNERPGGLAIVGMIVTLLGTYLLHIISAKKDPLAPFKLLFSTKASVMMLLSILLTSIVTVFDKLAINNTFPQNSVFVLFAEDLLIALGFLPILYFRNPNFGQQIAVNKKILVLIALIMTISNILAFTAIGGGDIGIVTTIMRSQVLFVLLFSFLFFKDRPRLETILGSAIMIAGLVLIRLGS